MITKEELASKFDHTYLKAVATKEDIDKLCEEAMAIGAASVAINNAWTKYCAEKLKDSNVMVDTAVGFPLGQDGLASKIAQAECAIAAGADELDYVLDIGKVLEGDYDYIEREMKHLTDLAQSQGVGIKVILETCYLNPEQIQKVCQIAAEVKPDFVKTSTGFGPAGAKAEDVQLMADTVKGSGVKVKAAGGIRNLQTALDMLDAGAERLGCSASVAILEELENLKQ